MADAENNKCRTCLKITWSVVKKNSHALFMVIGVLVGVLFGIILRVCRPESSYTNREAMYVGFLGEMFMKTLKCVAQPLMVTCLISAIGTLDIKLSKRIGGQFVAYMLITKVFAVAYGMILAIIIQPGTYGHTAGNKGMSEMDQEITAVDNVLDLLRNTFPRNLVGISMETYTTLLVRPYNDSNNTDYGSWEMVVDGKMMPAVNIIGLISAAIIIGISIAILNSKGPEMKILLEINESILGCLMQITIWVLNIAPILVAFLVAEQVLRMDSFESLMSKLGMYLVTIIFAYLSFILFFYPLLYFAFTRKNPFRYIWNYNEALATGWGTGSSLACVPVSIRCLTLKNNMEKKLVDFIVPVGANLNMDGDAIFQGLAPILIAQFHNESMNGGKYLLIIILGVAASLASAAVPSSAIIMLVLVLDGIGLPKTDIGVIFAVDWMVDRTSTCVNILGDAIGLAIIQHYNRKFLEKAALDDSSTQNNEKPVA